MMREGGKGKEKSGCNKLQQVSPIEYSMQKINKLMEERHIGLMEIYQQHDRQKNGTNCQF